MSWGMLHAAMLAGLAAAAVPVLVHLLNRRRDEVVDWGAMQFLELGPPARRRIRLTERLLLLTRIGLLALVALALARPFWSDASAGGGGGGGSDVRRDVVLVVDGSASMERRAGGTTPHAQAMEWARGFIKRLRPGDTVAVLVASDRVRPLIDPPSADRERVDAALAALRPARGSSDLPAALADAFRILEGTANPAREVIVLTDGQRFAWRPGEPQLWRLLRELRRRLPVPPRLWALTLEKTTPSDGPDGAIGPLSVSHRLVTPGQPLTVSATLSNAGPGPLARTVELLVDGRPAAGSARTVGPIPAGASVPLEFRTALATAGSHLLTVRLADSDALPGDDESALPIEVADTLPVLLVDGAPGLEPFRGATDFLHAALAPTGADTAQVRASVVPLDGFGPEALKDQGVVLLANVARLDPEQADAVARFVDAGGGLLVIPGDRTDPGFFNSQPWMPARLEDRKERTATPTHPSPPSFQGPFAPFGQGTSPALGEADLFAYRVLAPAPGASVLARLDTGDPWIVARPQGEGRVLLLAAAVDAGAGTLPVNPDFVPLVHEWTLHLAAGREPRVLPPGEPLVFDLDPPPDGEVKTLALQTPTGATVNLPVTRSAGSAQVRYDAPTEPGVYRLSLPGSGGDAPTYDYATVAADPREFDLAPLDPTEAGALAQGWPLAFESAPGRLTAHLDTPQGQGRHEVWRPLILAALAGLCVEIYLTRRLAAGR